MSNLWHNVAKKRIEPDDFLVVIEISKGAKKKYELDKETGAIILDRVLYTSMQYPSNYGFIPRTLSEDGDALDVLVLCSESIDPLCLVRCYPIGVITMIDSGVRDEKIVAIPYNDPLYNTYKNISKLPKHVSEELIHFLSVYKQLEDKITKIEGLQNVVIAKKVIKLAKKRYDKKFGDAESL
ncbi:MAG: inorganic diphosphatase [Clostridia bacterium]